MKITKKCIAYVAIFNYVSQMNYNQLKFRMEDWGLEVHKNSQGTNKEDKMRWIVSDAILKKFNLKLI